QSITAVQIQNNYHSVPVANLATATVSTTTSAKRVRVLIVPGHQPTSGGTEFGGVKERDVASDIANALAGLLSQNPHYDVMVSRSTTEWNPILQNYFDTHMPEIEAFTQSQKAQMQGHLADGSILPAADQVYHDTAPSNAAYQLYGINKWTSDNGYDITLHLHINDDSEHRAGVAGEYSGFAVYVPDHQYSNAVASKTIGEAIALRLSAYHATSTLPKEDAGVVEDQELIAIGSNNSADDAALLIEYGYIYEPQFQESSIRPVAVADYAYQTYLGLQDFFKDPILTTFGSVSFPYDWTKVAGTTKEKGPGVYALQEALHYLDYYPPKGKNFSDCPISGVVRDCTRASIKEYQRARGLPATGVIGPETSAALFYDTAKPSTPSVTLK
ncbi:MAG: N-acetylmuramoyl-L-alanine amidase, partial [Candidatus Parcubacteria bacterium]|nr:N-acetylmuramoyl-L-alanine amidase [Candidatus Parcubacteria bacterium]